MFHGLKRALNSIAGALLPPETKLGLFPSTDNKWYVLDHAGNKTILGDGIANIELVEVEGLVKTYRITRESGAPFEFEVTDGVDGRSIVSIELTDGTGAPGTVDTYTITYSKAPLTSTFNVYNGSDGQDGLVLSVNGISQADIVLDTDDIAEGSNNLYFTAARVRDNLLTGLSLATNAAITAADTILSAFGKLQKQLSEHFVAEDPHPQYQTQAEGDARYSQLTHTHTSAQITDFTEAAQDATGAMVAGNTEDGVQVDYDDATNKLNFTNTDKGSAARTAHEAAADPHPQYTTAAEASAAASSAVAAHEAAADPHPEYTTAAEAATAASSAVATHEAAADPHPQYLTTAEAQALIPPNKLSARISTLFASPANSTAITVVLSLAIPSGYLTQGKSFDFDLEGTQSQSAAATNVVGAIFVNNTQLVSAAVAGGTAAQTNRSIRMKGGIMWNGANYLGNITTAISGVLPVGNANVAGVAVAAGTAHNIDIRVQTSTANAANIIRAMVAAIKEI